MHRVSWGVHCVVFCPPGPPRTRWSRFQYAYLIAWRSKKQRMSHILPPSHHQDIMKSLITGPVLLLGCCPHLFVCALLDTSLYACAGRASFTLQHMVAAVLRSSACVYGLYGKGEGSVCLWVLISRVRLIRDQAKMPLCMSSTACSGPCDHVKP